MEEGISSESLLGKLGQVQDPRSRQGRRYPFPGLIALLILGALDGESSLRGMWMWGCKRWRKIASPLGFVGNPRPPVYGTVWYLLSMLDAEVLEQVFGEWMRSWAEERSRTVSVDGKVLRGSHREGPAEPALEVVTAVSQEFKRVLGQQGVGEGGQIAAALRLLTAIPLQGKLVVADAGLLCRPLVDRVLEQGGDYLGVVKDNQAEVKGELEEWIERNVSPPGPRTPGG